MNWTNVDSGNLGVYFEGYSGKHYGFDLEWRSQIKTTTTTTTIATATQKRRQSRKKKKKQTNTNTNRGKVGFIETVKRRYELLIKRREQIGGNQSLQRFDLKKAYFQNFIFFSRIIEKFNKLITHVFADQDRKSKLRPCYLPQGSSLENSDIPPLFLNQINSATTSTKIMSILTAIISRQDQLCRETSRRRVTHPKRWLQWFDNRSTRLKERENMHFI